MLSLVQPLQRVLILTYRVRRHPRLQISGLVDDLEIDRIGANDIVAECAHGQWVLWNTLMPSRHHNLELVILEHLHKDLIAVPIAEAETDAASMLAIGLTTGHPALVSRAFDEVLA